MQFIQYGIFLVLIASQQALWNKRSISRIHYECSHFRPIVGKMILEKMFNQPQALPEFGFLLNPQTIEQVLEHMQHGANNWLESHDNILEDIAKANWL